MLADVEEQERLHRIDLDLAEPLELILDDVEKKPVQPFDQAERFKIGQVPVARRHLRQRRMIGHLALRRFSGQDEAWAENPKVSLKCHKGCARPDRQALWRFCAKAAISEIRPRYRSGGGTAPVTQG